MLRVETPSGYLAYEVLRYNGPWRDADPMLLHHGVGLHAGFWDGWLPTLTAHYPVVRFDMRGHGRSAVPPAGYPWSFERFAADVFAVLAAAGYERCHFIGESLGGTIGLYLASRYPQRIRSLAVLSTAYQGQRIANLDDWAEAFAQGSAAWSRMMMPRRLDPAAVEPGLYAWFEAEQAKAHGHVVLGMVDLLRRTDLSADVPRIQAPCLVLSPIDSPFVSADLASDLQRLVPRAEIQYFRGARHGLFVSHAAQCAQAVVDFLARRL
jgi:pimeloyl-ACP methyl ester carboxylesterase